MAFGMFRCKNVIIIAMFIHCLWNHVSLSVISTRIFCNDTRCDFKPCDNSNSCDQNQYICSDDVSQCTLQCDSKCKQITIASSALYTKLICKNAKACSDVHISIAETQTATELHLACEEASSCSQIHIEMPENAILNMNCTNCAKDIYITRLPVIGTTSISPTLEPTLNPTFDPTSVPTFDPTVIPWLNSDSTSSSSDPFGETEAVLVTNIEVVLAEETTSATAFAMDSVISLALMGGICLGLFIFVCVVVCNLHSKKTTNGGNDGNINNVSRWKKEDTKGNQSWSTITMSGLYDFDSHNESEADRLAPAMNDKRKKESSAEHGEAKDTFGTRKASLKARNRGKGNSNPQGYTELDKLCFLTANQLSIVVELPDEEDGKTANGGMPRNQTSVSSKTSLDLIYGPENETVSTTNKK